MVPERAWLNTREAAELAGVSQSAVLGWLKQYPLGPKVVGRHRIDRYALERLLLGELVPRGVEEPRRPDAAITPNERAHRRPPPDNVAVCAPRKGHRHERDTDA